MIQSFSPLQPSYSHFSASFLNPFEALRHPDHNWGGIALGIIFTILTFGIGPSLIQWIQRKVHVLCVPLPPEASKAHAVAMERGVVPSEPAAAQASRPQGIHKAAAPSPTVVSIEPIPEYLAQEETQFCYEVLRKVRFYAACQIMASTNEAVPGTQTPYFAKFTYRSGNTNEITFTSDQQPHPLSMTVRILSDGGVTHIDGNPVSQANEDKKALCTHLLKGLMTPCHEIVSNNAFCSFFPDFQFGSCVITIGANYHRILTEPEWYIERLAQALRYAQQHGFRGEWTAHWIDDKACVEAAEGIGPINEFFDSLSSAVTQSQKLLFLSVQPDRPDMMLPQTSEQFSEEKPLFPQLSLQEQERFTTLGLIFGRIQRGNVFPEVKTGKHFYEGLFRAIPCLSQEELQTSWQDLEPETLYKMATALLSPYPDAEKNNLIILNWLTNYNSLVTNPTTWMKNPSEEIREHELEMILEAYGAGTDTPPPAVGDSHVGFIQRQSKLLKDALQFLFHHSIGRALSSGAPEACLARALAPIHAMAQGIYPAHADKWELLQRRAQTRPDILGDIIQGRILKKQLIKTLRRTIENNSLSHSNMKIAFLINWVERSSDEKIATLMKFISGTATSIQFFVTIEENAPSPLLRASTCGNQLIIPDHPKLETQEGFDYWLERSLFEQGGLLNH